MIKIRDKKQNREILSAKNYTLDALQYKNLKLLQNKKGYRSSEDSLILLNIILENIGISFSGTAFEFGTGSCIIAILLAAKLPQISITAIEVQPSLFELAQKNIVSNHLSNRISLIEMNGKEVKSRIPFKKFDIAFSNPPFYPVGRGRLSPDEEKRNARHEILCTMDDVIESFDFLLKKNGLGFIIYPTFRWREFDDKIRGNTKKFVLQKYYFFRDINNRLFDDMFNNCSSSADYEKILEKSNLFVAKIKRL
ncbi:MAG: methyltransferase [Candidatus Cloacimonadota bacterium]|nr:methyltransferase [Candidatus Cloacimonadota bacterium]